MSIPYYNQQAQYLYTVTEPPHGKTASCAFFLQVTGTITVEQMSERKSYRRTKNLLAVTDRQKMCLKK